MAYEFENELEDEFEEELEDETEGEEFLGDLLGEGEDFLGSILGESEDFLGSILGEAEDESEGEDELEAGLNPIRKIYPDAMMEHLGELAAESESEDEAAEHFLPLIGMAASKLLPIVARAVAPAAKRALRRIAKALTRATPKLTKGIGHVAKALHRNPQTRHLLRVVPGIARRTVGTLAHRAARGAKIAPATAVRTLARQARHVLGSPQIGIRRCAGINSSSASSIGAMVAGSLVLTLRASMASIAVAAGTGAEGKFLGIGVPTEWAARGAPAQLAGLTAEEEPAGVDVSIVPPAAHAADVR